MKTLPAQNLPVIISLTTISSRKKAAVETIKRLLVQRTEVNYEVHLFVSQEPYLLDEGFKFIPNEFKDLLNSYGHFRVKWVLNTGPYRKLLPALTDAWVSGLDRIIITCDDDVDYPEDFLETILEAHYKDRCITAFRGYTIQVEDGKILPYQAWQQAGREKKSIKNIPTGKDGILYRASYFDEGVFNVEDIIANAPTSDDLWFKWHTTLKRVPVKFIEHGGGLEFASSEDLNVNQTLWRKFNKYGGNDRTVSQLENLFSEKGKESVSSILSQRLKEAEISEADGSVPSLLKSANAALRRRDLVGAEYLYKQIIARKPHNKEARFNLALIGLRRKDVRGVVALYQFMQKSKNDRGLFSKLENKAHFSFKGGLVLVIIPAFNSESTLRQSVESVLNQTYKNIFVVIVNDCSDDATLSISFDLERQYQNVVVISTDENGGPFIACNYALDLMGSLSFEYFIKHDADDLMDPQKIAKQIVALNSGRYFFCTTGYTRISFPEGNVVSGKDRGHNMTMYRKDVFDEIGFFDDTRFGGDSEFLDRATLCFGVNAEIHIKERLTLAYTMPGSLVEKNPLGSEARKKYVDSYKEDHDKWRHSKGWYKKFKNSLVVNVNKESIEKSLFRFKCDEKFPYENRSSGLTVCVAFPTFNRQSLMERLVSQLDRASSKVNLVVLVFDDGSSCEAKVDWEKYPNIKKGCIIRYENHGKKRYWSLVNKIFSEMKNIRADYYFYLGDDLEVQEDFFEKTVSLWRKIDDPNKISLNLLNDGRDECWTKFKRKRIKVNDAEVYLSQWLDMVMMVSPRIFDYELYEIPLSRWDENPLISSGVGAQLSARLLNDGWNMYQTVESHVFHGTHESEMNPEERRLRPLVAVS